MLTITLIRPLAEYPPIRAPASILRQFAVKALVSLLVDPPSETLRSPLAPSYASPSMILKYYYSQLQNPLPTKEPLFHVSFSLTKQRARFCGASGMREFCMQIGPRGSCH